MCTFAEYNNTTNKKWIYNNIINYKLFLNYGIRNW